MASDSLFIHFQLTQATKTLQADSDTITATSAIDSVKSFIISIPTLGMSCHNIDISICCHSNCSSQVINDLGISQSISFF